MARAAACDGVQIASTHRGQPHPDERLPITEFGECDFWTSIRCPSTPRRGSHEPGPYPSGQPLDGVHDNEDDENDRARDVEVDCADQLEQQEPDSARADDAQNHDQAVVAHSGISMSRTASAIA